MCIWTVDAQHHAVLVLPVPAPSIICRESARASAVSQPFSLEIEPADSLRS